MKEGSGGSELTIKSEADHGQWLISITTRVGLSGAGGTDLQSILYDKDTDRYGLPLVVDHRVAWRRLWTGVPGTVQLFSFTLPPRRARILPQLPHVTRPYYSVLSNRSNPRLDLFGVRLSMPLSCVGLSETDQRSKIGTSTQNGDALPARGETAERRVRLREKPSIIYEITSRSEVVHLRAPPPDLRETAR